MRFDNAHQRKREQIGIIALQKGREPTRAPPWWGGE
jgi:hypothetical protein